MDKPHHHRPDRTRGRDRGHTRSRSKSPSHSHRRSHRHPRSRSRSPTHHSRRHHTRSRSPRRRKRTRTPSPSPAPAAPAAQAPLPFNAPPLTKHGLGAAHVRAIFSDYLDIQKGLYLDSLSTRELKGRYKRFVSHYNRGELARGWYERAVKESSSTAANPPSTTNPTSTTGTPSGDAKRKPRHPTPPPPEEADTSEDEIVGPFLPGQEPHKRRKLGAARPTFEDLEMQKEQTAAATALAHADVRHERKAERRAQTALLDELAPRADAGTHARRLEKKADITAKLSSFKERSPGLEVDDATLMGGEDGGGTEGFKQKKAALERKKNDRELRKEQLLQARIAEREERMAMHRVKEERTMAMLRALAGRFQ